MGLPRPYYEARGITVYHGDALDLIPELIAARGQNFSDLLLADPPYGVSYVSSRRYALPEFGAIAGDKTIDMGAAIVAASWPALRHNRHAYIFGPAEIGPPVAYATPRVELIWAKMKTGAGNLECPWGPAHEPIGFYVKNGPGEHGLNSVPARLRRGSVLSAARPNATAVVNHPTEKPVPLLRELIESSSRIGETVFDPCAGSLSSMIAALLEGRLGIAIELEEKYCEVGTRRLESAAAIAMVGLFAEENNGLGFSPSIDPSALATTPDPKPR